VDKVPATPRARRRNLTAIAASAGLLVFSCICVATLIATFGGHGHKAAAETKHPAHARAHVTRATTTTRPGPATTTSSTTTTIRAVTTTTAAPSTTTTTVAPPPVTEPPTTAATIPTTTTTVAVTATASVSNSPHFCTVTVRLSTGAQAAYSLDAFLASPGDSYVFDATLGGYSVEISANVTGTSQSPQCAVTLGSPARV
jgi:hypothetical protein